MILDTSHWSNKQLSDFTNESSIEIILTTEKNISNIGLKKSEGRVGNGNYPYLRFLGQTLICKDNGLYQNLIETQGLRIEILTNPKSQIVKARILGSQNPNILQNEIIKSWINA